jgi:hypothetical protein
LKFLPYLKEYKQKIDEERELKEKLKKKGKKNILKMNQFSKMIMKEKCYY